MPKWLVVSLPMTSVTAFKYRPHAACYADVMSIRRITISVPAKVAGKIKRAAGGRPVSAWVTEVLEERLDDSELQQKWEEFYEQVKPSREDTRRADAIFRRLTRRSRRRGAA